MSRIAACLFLAALSLGAQNRTGQTKVIRDRVQQLRNLPDAERANVTRQLALQIRQLLPAASRLSLAQELANFATQGDLGHDTLQEVTTTLAQALTEHRGSRESYLTLARLVRYEHMQVFFDNAQLKAARLQLEDDDHARQRADFTLPDLNGTSWRLKSLSGKVVDCRPRISVALAD